MNKAEALEQIHTNIVEHGYHVYVVSGGPSPRYAYSIGLSEVIGLELVLAGASFYSREEVGSIIDVVAATLKANSDWQRAKISIDLSGTFSLCEVDVSWSGKLMVGALDYYGTLELAALAIVPDTQHYTADVPNMSQPWNADAEPVWQWLDRPWTYNIPKSTTVVTNLGALTGTSITEAMRWEEAEWELFAGAGPDVAKSDIRVVPIGTLLGIDRSIEPVINLAVGEGLWRDPVALEWHPWNIS